MSTFIQSLRPPRKYDEYCTRAQRPEHNIHGRIFERTSYRLSLFCVKFLRILLYFLTRKRRTLNMNVKHEFRICLFMFLSKVVMVQGWLSCCQPQNRNLFSVTYPQNICPVLNEFPLSFSSVLNKNLNARTRSDCIAKVRFFYEISTSF